MRPPLPPLPPPRPRWFKPPWQLVTAALTLGMGVGTIGGIALQEPPVTRLVVVDLRTTVPPTTAVTPPGAGDDAVRVDEAGSGSAPETAPPPDRRSERDGGEEREPVPAGDRTRRPWRLRLPLPLPATTRPAAPPRGLPDVPAGTSPRPAGTPATSAPPKKTTPRAPAPPATAPVRQPTVPASTRTPILELLPDLGSAVPSPPPEGPGASRSGP